MKTTLITKETPVIQMSFVEKEKMRLNAEKADLEAKLNEGTIISEEDYKKACDSTVKKKQTEKQNVIDSYKKQQEIQEKLSKIEKELLSLKPFQVAVDVGKYNVKQAYLANEEDVDFVTDIFESRAQRASECSHDTGKKLRVGSEVYSTSGAAKRVSDKNSVTSENIEPMNNTKAHEYHRVLLLKALYNIYLQTGRRVFNVGVGTSIDNYIEDSGARVYLTMLDEKLPAELQARVDQSDSKKEQNEIYKNYVEELKSKFISKEFTVRETGQEAVTLIINDLYVAPETVTGATMIDVEDLEHAYVIDIGGLNESFLPIVNFSPCFDDVITNKNGMAHKYEAIANWLVSKSSDVTSMSRENVEVILNNRDTMLKQQPHFEELIKDYMTTYFNGITDSLKRNGIALQEGVTTLIFIGGGSQVLAPYIRDYYSTVCDMQGKIYIAEKDGIYSNVTGIYEASTNYFDEREYDREEAMNKAC